jgi:hypothetical protein
MKKKVFYCSPERCTIFAVDRCGFGEMPAFWLGEVKYYGRATSEMEL